MHTLFPEMMYRPKMSAVISIFVYWFMAFIFIPFLIPVAGFGFWQNIRVVAWLELIYYLINAAAVTGILKDHLKDGFFAVQIDAAPILKTAAITLGLMLASVLIWAGICLLLFATPAVLVDIFPVVPMYVALTPGLLAEELPLFGTLGLTLLTPISICGLFYASAFSPVCYRYPKLAYPVVSLVILLPCLFNIFWRGNTFFVLITYAVQLPVHLFACWSYQKTDNIWTPIFSLTALNLLSGTLSAVFL